MEISTFVRYRPSWRGILFVLVLVLVAGGIAAYLTYRKDANYEARASVFVGQILPADVPDYLLRPLADNYQSALELPRVTRAAAEASGEPEGAIESGLTSERVSSTAYVDVTYESTDPEAAQTVLRVASREALIAVAENDLEREQRSVTAATEAYDDATAALSEYEATNGADGSARHAELSGNVTRTLDELNAARDALDGANLELQEAENADVISVKEPAEESKIPDTARAGVTAGVIAAMVAFIILLLVDWRRRPKVKWSAPPPAITARHDTWR
jgi:uncharacterized protein involved in exopolysaccharide biosynthesis